MASTNRTQIRLQQVTGSLVNLKTEAAQYKAPATAAALTGSDLQDVLGAMAAAIQRIHGAASDEPFNNTAGVFNQDVTITGTTPTLTIGDNGAEDVALVFDNSAQDYYMAVDHSDSQKLLVGLGSTVGSSAAITLDSSANVLFAGDVTTTGRTLVDDTTEATTTTDGSLQTDGGLSVAKSVVIGDDLDLLSNDAIFKVGNAQPFTLTHANANNTATITADHRLAFGNAADYITGDGSDLSVISSNDVIVQAANKVTLDGQGTDDGDGVEIFLGTDNATTKFMVANNSGAEKFRVDGAGNVIITGDLQVQGSTTTVSSSNTTFQDSIIGLGVSGSNEFDNSGDRAIIFARAANATDALPALNWNGSQFELAKYAADPSSGSMGTAISFADLKVNDLELVGGIALPDSAGDHTLTLEANGDNLSANRTLDFIVADSGGTDANRTLHIEANTVKLDQDYTTDADVQFNKVTANGGLVADNITIDGTEIDLSSGDLTIDVAANLILDADTEVQIKDGGTLYGTLSGSLSGESAGLFVSASNGSLVLDASSQGAVFFADTGTKYALFSQDSSNAMLGAVSNKDLVFVHDNLDTTVEIMRIDESAEALVFPRNNATGNAANTGILAFDGTNGLTEAIYGDGNALFLRSNNVNFKLPTADGSANEVLQTNGSGELSFTSLTGNVSKRQMTIIAALSSGSALNPNSATVSNTAPYTRSALDLDGISGASLDNLVDVYVNGQLLISGSDANVGAGTADYLISTHSDASQLKFGFDLEVDDTVIINQKG